MQFEEAILASTAFPAFGLFQKFAKRKVEAELHIEAIGGPEAADVLRIQATGGRT